MARLSVVEAPETRYAATRVGKIAYQIVGDGPITVLVEPRSWLPIDLMWDEPRMVRFLDRLSLFCTQLWFDPRGRGASDPISRNEGRLAESVVDDMVCLMDAVGWNQAAVLALAATHEVLLAATHPERVTALVLVEPAVRFRQSPDYPEGWDDDTVERHLGHLERHWGTGANLRLVAPSVAGDRRLTRWFARCERLAMSPAEASWRLRSAFDVDLRHVLPAITIPALVVSRGPGSGLSRYVAEHIADCRHVEDSEPGHLFFTGDCGALLDGIEEFLTGRLPTRDLRRVLATVLFTDVVGSTEHMARLGDRRWMEILADHNVVVRAELARFRGHEIKCTGDGFLATFDGPGRAIRAALAIAQAVRPLDIDVRAGLHTGEIESVDNDISGVAVHIAQRISTIAGAGKVLASGVVRDLVGGSGIEFENQGDHQLRGIPGNWRLYSVVA